MRETMIGHEALLAAALPDRYGWEAAGLLLAASAEGRAALATTPASVVAFDEVTRPALGDALCDEWLSFFASNVRVAPVGPDEVEAALALTSGGSLLSRIEALAGCLSAEEAAARLGLAADGNPISRRRRRG